MNLDTIDLITAIATCISALATTAMAIVAGIQLSKMSKSLNDSNLMSNFEIEFELNRRKERVADLRKENQDFIDENGSDNLTQEQRERFKVLHGRYDEALENYLNVFDRLCYFILKNKLTEEDFRTEYRDMLRDTIKGYKEKFGEESPYRNMKKLHNKWADE